MTFKELKKKLNEGFYYPDDFMTIKDIPLGVHRTHPEEWDAWSKDLEEATVKADAVFRKDVEEVFGMTYNPKASLLWKLVWDKYGKAGKEPFLQEYEYWLELI